MGDSIGLEEGETVKIDAIDGVVLGSIVTSADGRKAGANDGLEEMPKDGEREGLLEGPDTTGCVGSTEGKSVKINDVGPKDGSELGGNVGSDDG